MIMSKEEFKKELYDFLSEIGSPEAEDSEFIEYRSSAAYKEYSVLIESGYYPFGALEIAHSVLFDGVGAGFMFLMYCLEDEFPEVPEDDRKLFAREVYPSLEELLLGAREEELGEHDERFNKLAVALAPKVASKYWRGSK